MNAMSSGTRRPALESCLDCTDRRQVVVGKKTASGLEG